MCYWIWLDLMIWFFFVCLFSLDEFYLRTQIMAHLAYFLFGIWFCESQDLIAFWGEQQATAAFFVYLYCQTNRCLSATSIGPTLLLFMNLKGCNCKKKKRKAVLRVECNYYFFLLHSLIDVKHPTQFTSDAERKRINDHRFSATAAICIHYSAS